MNILAFLRANARWLLGGLLLTVFSSFGQTYFIALFGSEIRATFSLSHGEFGGIYMLGTLASAFSLVWLGRVVDFFPVSLVAVGVCTALSIACLMMSVVSSAWMLVVVIFGLRLFGQGMMSHTAMVAMGRWYSAERGRAVSITSMGHQLGEGLLPLVMVSLIGWIGWRETWVLAAVLLIFIAMPAVYLLMKTERVPRNATVAQSASVAPENIRHWTRGEVISDPLFWILATGVLAPAFIGTSFFFHQTHIGEIKDWSRELIAGSFIIMSITAVTFTLWSGVLIDRYSARHLLPVFLVPLGIGSLLLGTVRDPSAIVFYMILQGMSYGFSTALFGAVWPEVYGTRYLGSVRAMIMSAMVLASALGPGVTGWLIDRGVGYEFQLLVMGFYCLVAAGVMIPVSQVLGRRLTNLVPAPASGGGPVQ